MQFEAVKLANKMRSVGMPTVLARMGSLKSQMREAGHRTREWGLPSVTHTVILGDEEWARGEVILRDLEQSEQVELTLEQLLELKHFCAVCPTCGRYDERLTEPRW